MLIFSFFTSTSWTIAGGVPCLTCTGHVVGGQEEKGYPGLTVGGTPVTALLTHPMVPTHYQQIGQPFSLHLQIKDSKMKLNAKYLCLLLLLSTFKFYSSLCVEIYANWKNLVEANCSLAKL